MKYFIDVVRSHILESGLKECKRLRERSINWHEGQDKSESSRWRDLKLRVRQTRIGHLTRHVLQNGTFANYIFRSVFGFCGGALLSLLLLTALVFQVNMSVQKATLLCAMLAPFLALGLALSTKVRCATLLVMPQLSSKRGRQALVAFAYILALNGPMANTLYNLGETSQSLACGQEQARTAMGRLAAAVKEPLVTAKRAVGKAMSSVRTAVQRLRESVGALERVVSAIVGVFKSAHYWLGSVVNICNRKMGTPTERCLGVFVSAAHDCSAHLGPLFSWLCGIVYITSLVCYTLAFLGLLCKVIHMVADAVSGAIKRTAKRFTAYVRTALYVDVDFHHSFQVDLERNVTLKSIARAIQDEMKATTEPVGRVYRMAGGVLGLTWMIVFIKALQYHHKFLVADRFDNVYITRQLKEVDFARARRGLECVLPLRITERCRFCRPTQLRLLPSERLHLARSVVFLLMSTLNLVLLVNVDYGLFWLLDRLRAHATFVTSVPPMQGVELQVEGQGLVPDMFRNISASLLEDETATEAPPEELDPAACLPNPRQPDINKYYQIMLLMTFAWLMALAEPFILRLRPTILSSYYPERAQQRAVWLCGFILRERGGAMRTIARMAGKRTSLGGGKMEPLGISTLFERLKDHSRLFRLLCGSKSRPACVVCASPEGPDEPLVSCEALGCSARYCAACFSTQDGGLCRVCGQPLEQPEVPGLELEIDSSDEEVDVVVVTRDDVSPLPSDVTEEGVDSSSDRGSIFHPRVPQDEVPREASTRPLWRRVRAILANVVLRPVESQYHALEQEEEEEPMELKTEPSLGYEEPDQDYRLTNIEPDIASLSDLDDSPISTFHPRGYVSVPQDELPRQAQHEVPRKTRPLWQRVKDTLTNVVPHHHPVESQYHALEQGEEPDQDYRLTKIKPDMVSSSDLDGSPVSGVSIFHPRGYASVPQDEVPQEAPTQPLWQRVRASLANVAPSPHPVESHVFQEGEDSMEMETEPSLGYNEEPGQNFASLSDLNGSPVSIFSPGGYVPQDEVPSRRVRAPLANVVPSHRHVRQEEDPMDLETELSLRSSRDKKLRRYYRLTMMEHDSSSDPDDPAPESD